MANLVVWLSVGWLGLSASAQAEQSYADFRRSRTDGLSGWIDFKASEYWNLRVGSSHQDYTIDALASRNFGMANNTTLLQGGRVRRQTYSNGDDTGEAQAVGLTASL